jgi:hypothetical protein
MEARHRTAAAEIYQRARKKLARSGSLMEDDFVSVKISKNHKVQQLSISRSQQVQYQLLKNNKLQ